MKIIVQQSMDGKLWQQWKCLSFGNRDESLKFDVNDDWSIVPGITLAPHTGRLFMFIEVTLESKRLATSPTGIRLFGGVCLDMRTQVWLVRKCFPTLWAFEWFFSCVSSDVTLKQPRSWEAFTTEGTFTSLVVCAHMHTVRRHGYIDFLTMRTLSSFFVIDTAMGLPMAGKIAGSAVSFATFWTNVIVTTAYVTPCLFNKIIKVITVDPLHFHLQLLLMDMLHIKFSWTGKSTAKVWCKVSIPFSNGCKLMKKSIFATFLRIHCQVLWVNSQVTWHWTCHCHCQPQSRQPHGIFWRKNSKI